ncbi:MAG: bifunctional diguanylate cyclase/phosphodiesterase [Treponema sp.]|nr:bifunctional diguanylate cyclase/phosphodiesterase [Treponema sp.]
MTPNFSFESIVDVIKIPLLIASPIFSNGRDDGVITDFTIHYVNSEFKKEVYDIGESDRFSAIAKNLTQGYDWITAGAKVIRTRQMVTDTFYSKLSNTWFSIEIQYQKPGIVVATLTDITAKIKYSEQLKLSVVTDALTDLPNRMQFYKTIREVIDDADRHGTRFAAILFDLDNMKSINDSKGQQEGDRVLVKTARILKNFERKDIKVFRFGDDEFLILATNLDYVDSVYTICDVIQESFLSENIGISGGIALYPDSTREQDDLIKFADLAMHDAKMNGKNHVSLFTAEMQRDFLRKLQFRTKMPIAFHNNEFSLNFQPQFDIKTTKLRGFEALLRWHSETFGNISPEEFVPIAEDSGFIHELGTWVLRKAFECQKRWEDTYPEYKGIMSINVSPVQLMSDGFIERLSDLLIETNVDTNHIEIEVTEGVFINDKDKALDILNRIKAMGLGISLDDFGTGYSSLSYLQLLPLTTLKIDKSFIQSITDNNGVSENITNAIISMVTNMGLDTIAEGVEKIDQLEILKKLECKNVQGFLRGKPMPQDLIESYLGGNESALSKIES